MHFSFWKNEMVGGRIRGVFKKKKVVFIYIIIREIIRVKKGKK